jgi:hypothetical protein
VLRPTVFLRSQATVQIFQFVIETGVKNKNGNRKYEFIVELLQPEIVKSGQSLQGKGNEAHQITRGIDENAQDAQSEKDFDENLPHGFLVFLHGVEILDNIIQHFCQGKPQDKVNDGHIGNAQEFYG